MEEPIQFLFECPVCFDPIIPPFNQCIGGHLLCHECIPKLENCPICRMSLDKKRIRNLELEKVAGKFKYFCQYKHLSCDAILKLDELSGHKYTCQFMAGNYCPSLGIRCKKHIPIGEILSHLREAHEISSLLMESGPIEVHQEGNLSSAYEISKYYWNPVVLVDGEYKFCLLTELKEGVMSWTIVVVGNQGLAKQFTACITLISYTQEESLSWEGPVASLQSVKNERSRFSVPMDALYNFSRKTQNAEKFWWSQPSRKGDVEWKLQIRIEKIHNSGSYNDSLIVRSQHLLNDSFRICYDKYCVSCGDTFQDKPSYKCVKCHSYILCQNCVDMGIHSRHLFFRVPKNRLKCEMKVTVNVSIYDSLSSFSLSFPTDTDN